MTTVEAFVACLLRPVASRLLRGIEHARDPKIESIERQRREEDRLRRLRRRFRG